MKIPEIKLLILRYWFAFAILLLTIVGASMRMYQLGQVPHGMTWDEAAIGYNGFAIFTTRRDEWLFRLPVSFRSFGDYKAPLGIYINGFFTHFLGLHLFAVRLPFTLASIAGIPGIILLSEQLLILCGSSEQKKNRQLSLLIGLLLTFSPWHFHFSRLAFETGMMASFVIWGCFLLCCLLNGVRGQSFKKSFLLSFLSALLLVAAIYTYHSAKIFIPLLVACFCLLFWRQSWQKIKWIMGMGITSFFLLLPFIKDTLWATGGERFTQASVFGLDISLPEKLTLVVQHFFRHFYLDYLLFGATTTLRHGDGQWGVLLPTTFFLVLCGVFFGLTHRKSQHSKFFLLSVLWIAIGTLPAAIGRDVPHSNRDFLALPGFLFVAAFGWSELSSFLTKTRLNKKVSGSKGESDLLVKSVLGTLMLLHFLFVAQYLHHYFTVFAHDSASDFQDGYVAAAQFAIDHEDASDKVLFTSSYGQPYIFVIFLHRTNPIWYQGGSLIKYEFSGNIHVGDLDRNKTTIIATPQEIDPKQADQLIYGTDGKIRFVLIGPKEKMK